MALKHLVIGASGCIGTALLHKLARKSDVRALVHKEPISIEGVENVYGDVTDTETLNRIMKGVDVVYHLATPMSSIIYALPFRDIYKIVCTTTKHVVDTAIKRGVKRIVYMSSVSVYGKTKYMPIDERHPCEPVNHYGLTKLESEMILGRRAGEIEVVILRAAPVYGPKNKIFYDLFRNLEKGRIGIIGDGTKALHLLNVKNCAEALELAAHSHRAPGQIFNIADGEIKTFGAIYLMLSNMLGFKPKPPMPIWQARLLAIFSETASFFRGRPAKFSRAFLETLMRERLYSIEKAKNMLGYRPRYTIEQGFRETVEWYKQCLVDRRIR